MNPLTPFQRARAGTLFAGVSLAISFALAAVNIAVGHATGSSAVLATGLEFAGDVITSLIVFAGMLLASRPPDADHPYGHGRFEMLSAFVVGLLISAAGVAICWHSLQAVADVHPPPGEAGVWALSGSIVTKSVLSAIKFRTARRLGSSSLAADAWNDTVDILAGSAALVALMMTIADPARFLSADHYGGFAVGLIVVITGIRVLRDTSLELSDVMASPGLLQEIREAALSVPRVMGVEKCYARKTGLHYHVDLHLELDPEMTVRESHDIATQVRWHVVQRVPAVADVLVHVEPYDIPIA